MTNTIGMAAQLASSIVKTGWYLGLNRLVERQSRVVSRGPDEPPRRPVPTRGALLSAARDLLLDDARAVRDGIWSGAESSPADLIDHVQRLRQMMRALPDLNERRMSRRHDTVLEHVANHSALPDYFVQDFHFQSGGHLSEESARLYDIQVDTLFYGCVDAMRRVGLRPIAEHMRGRDQRSLQLTDVACGTGRFLREIRKAYPAMTLTGVDLSPAYLAEARKLLSNLRRVELIEANAEEIPRATASQDIVTCIYLFHELPPNVRSTVAKEIARVLKPGGRLIFIDSLQLSDQPDWDGLLEMFPVHFHEPYYRHYLSDDLTSLFAEAGLSVASSRLAFLSKMLVLARDAKSSGSP